MKKIKKHTLRFERNFVCALCAVIFLIFAGAAVAGWLAAPFPIGAVLTGVAAFVLVFTGILAVSWAKYAARFYRACRNAAFPSVSLGDGLSVTFYSLPAEAVTAYLRESASLPPLPPQYTREQWLERSRKRDEIKAKTLGKSETLYYSSVCSADLASLSGKTVVLRHKTYETYRSFFDYSPVKASNSLLFSDENE